MRYCKKCKEPLPTIVKVDGVRRNIHSRRYCLRCRPFKSGTGPFMPSGTRPSRDEDRLPQACEICQRVYVYDKGKGHSRRRCNSCMVNANRTARKLRAIALKGGGCQICGYNRCARALTFHHTDPATKDFRLSYGTFAWKTLLRELEKCVLICANCHAEVHAGVTKLKAQSELRR